MKKFTKIHKQKIAQKLKGNKNALKIDKHIGEKLTNFKKTNSPNDDYLLIKCDISEAIDLVEENKNLDRFFAVVIQLQLKSCFENITKLFNKDLKEFDEI
ncbi:MAG: hypothetical protein PHS54_01455 [Clostridia bacterium]|nr:hypothetical protein [Clostridia bacterium]